MKFNFSVFNSYLTSFGSSSYTSKESKQIILEPLDNGQETFLSFFFFFCFWGLHLRHMEVPRLRVKSELQLLATATAMATWDLSHVYRLHHRSQQRWIVNPLNEARDWTYVLMDTMPVCYHWAMMGTPRNFFKFPPKCLNWTILKDSLTSLSHENLSCKWGQI